MNGVNAFIVFAATLLASTAARAECDLDDVVGYTLVEKKTVDRWVDEDEREDGFSGCSHGRLIIFTDNTAVVCAEYGYQYAYRPDAYIFTDGSDLKMCVDDDLYDVRPFRGRR